MVLNHPKVRNFIMLTNSIGNSRLKKMKRKFRLEIDDNFANTSDVTQNVVAAAGAKCDWIATLTSVNDFVPFLLLSKIFRIRLQHTQTHIIHVPFYPTLFLVENCSVSITQYVRKIMFDLKEIDRKLEDENKIKFHNFNGLRKHSNKYRKTLFAHCANSRNIAK